MQGQKENLGRELPVCSLQCELQLKSTQGGSLKHCLEEAMVRGLGAEGLYLDSAKRLPDG